MDKKIKKSIFARIKQWLLNILGISKKDEDSNTKPASNEDQVPIEEKIFKKVKLIEEYLALDKIAFDSRAIDYSFITDEEVRCKLVANHIEMWRCYYGTRSHKQDFEQFCISVHMQAEALLRYWCDKKYTKEAALKAAQKKKTDITADKNGLLTYWALCILFYPKYSSDKDIFDTIRDLRNNIVHSTTIDRTAKEVDDKAKTFIKDEGVHLHYFCGIPTTVNAYVQSEAEYKEIKDIEEKLENCTEVEEKKELTIKKNIIESSSSKRKKRWDSNIGVDLNKYNSYLRLELMIHTTPYDQIVSALNRLRDNVEIELKNVR